MSAISSPALAIRRPASYYADFLALTKPEVNLLILIATFAGYYLGSAHSVPFDRLVITLCGTLLIASGTAALNQYMEWTFDARMRRTWRRPLAAGRLRPGTALWFGVSLSSFGAAFLAIKANALASVLATFTLAVYLFVYTPLKRKTPLCIFPGALAGAVPPMIGWAAAVGSVASPKAWGLYAVLFLWQFPHVMSIAWLYREDYARAGYFVLPSSGDRTFAQWLTAAPAVALFVASFALAAGNLERVATVILGSGILYFVGRFVIVMSKATARSLLKASILYLFLQMLLFVAER
jgi:heme o synthase